MRITNKIMQKNSLYNINNNKVLEDKLATSEATGKKFNRPSDDPVGAIRALRLRTNVSMTKQYLERNTNDAESWLNVTTDALSIITEAGENGILPAMIKKANEAANDIKNPEDLSAIYNDIKQLCYAFYDTGNTDYGGRYIFTGYRTDTSLTFGETVPNAKNTNNVVYNITQQLTKDDISEITFIDNAGVFELDDVNYKDKDAVVEQDVTRTSLYRLRLDYDKCDVPKGGVDPKQWAVPLVLTQGLNVWSTEGTGDSQIKVYEDPDEAKKAIADAMQADPTAKQVAYCYATGELIMTDNMYNLMHDSDDEIRVSYAKSSFAEDDFRPQHYYACTATPLRLDENGDIIVPEVLQEEVKKDDGSYEMVNVVSADGNVKYKETIEYNMEYLSGIREKQAITYDVGTTQQIRINNTADEVFKSTLRRDVLDLGDALGSFTKAYETYNTLKVQYEKSEDDATIDTTHLKEDYYAAKKTYEYWQDNITKMFSAAITKFQGVLDVANEALTDAGNRGMRLDLVSARLTVQKTTFEDLKSKNEDVDLAEIIVALESAKMAYDASLQATAKVLQNGLLNYIS